MGLLLGGVSIFTKTLSFTKQVFYQIFKYNSNIYLNINQKMLFKN